MSRAQNRLVLAGALGCAAGALARHLMPFGDRPAPDEIGRRVQGIPPNAPPSSVRCRACYGLGRSFKMGRDACDGCHGAGVVRL